MFFQKFCNKNSYCPKQAALLYATQHLHLDVASAEELLQALYQDGDISYWRTLCERYPEGIARSALRQVGLEDDSLSSYCAAILQDPTKPLAANEGPAEEQASSAHPPICPINVHCRMQRGIS